MIRVVVGITLQTIYNTKKTDNNLLLICVSILFIYRLFVMLQSKYKCDYGINVNE